MKKIILGLVLALVINSTAMAAHMLSDFPLGMSKAEAIAKGLVLQDQQGGLANILFGAKEWPTALVFENEKLVYLMLKGNGEDFLSSADYGLLQQLDWLVVYVSTDKNLVFDAIKLAASGMNETAIGDEYEKFQGIMQSQKFTNSLSVYVSERVWAAFKQLRGEKPADKYPDAAICSVTTNGNDITLVFSTFGYIDKMNK